MVVDALDRKSGDEVLLAGLRAYRNSVLFDETTLASPKAIASAVLIWLTRADGGLRVLLNLGIVVLAFAALLGVSRFARGLARRWVGRAPNLSKLLQAFLVAAVYWVVLVVGLLFVLAAHRDERLNGEILYSVREARIVIEQWRLHYNTVRPHSAFGYHPPAPESIIPMHRRPVMH